MSQDDLNTAIEQLRSALDEYKAQKNLNAFRLFHMSVGVSTTSTLQLKEAEYLEALGAAVLAIGEEIRQIPAYGTV
ncbi:hypothetical protein [Mycobacterium sp. E2479]|uniref:hypothetical protein n=1 Tax=Mycobacterium sp. E2479 TaxID=1834134 RepID=UPI0007FFEE40|nr:hypothetical protein [Mycobacterium sp. E2479]OBH55422.1 hypothetical protein A5686_06140 [Mycobacterium sp. E2479]